MLALMANCPTRQRLFSNGHETGRATKIWRRRNHEDLHQIGIEENFLYFPDFALIEKQRPLVILMGVDLLWARGAPFHLGLLHRVSGTSA
jgi:hypothetical protein